ncbi:hypothetical protein QS306_14405 [Paraburkholderia bonniea]|uniref:hypothetical protein n=1 Tax=Paraburkholderia bonniea TaxID=2152891 RepID=UPI001FE64C85|nr:hypothetical protein [Paraburkholderia bonniea]WJF91963.1 hypothetical protein QS306_14405 [Paraburkholderia bonniea]WJF95282.1 hypothetical protein QS308_14410 [Paraburkholderia bonniea]
MLMDVPAIQVEWQLLRGMPADVLALEPYSMPATNRFSLRHCQSEQSAWYAQIQHAEASIRS